jgi:hypothetical protein
MQQWNFPSNGNGRFDGFHDAAIDHFTDDRLGSFIRESIQNSLDARLDETKPVHVSFSTTSVSRENASSIWSLTSWLKKAEQTAVTAGKPKDAALFSAVSKELENSKNIPVLAVHDTNTRGLSGPLSGPSGSWFALTKGTGVNEKHSGGSLGSFGHGSKAPFAMTKMRTVFYFSKLPDSDPGNPGQERFQGKSILQSMVVGENEYTSGTGFFGIGEKCLPIEGESVPSWIKEIRSNSGFDTGTTLAIPLPTMFKDQQAWTEATIAVLASFYFAIKKGALEVTLQDLHISATNLASTFDDFKQFLDGLQHLDKDEMKSRILSVETIHSPSARGKLDSPTFGAVDYFIRTGPEIQWRKVGIARKSGMLITREAEGFRRFPDNKNFDLFICVGEDPGNELLRSMENPRHDSFSLDRIEDEAERKSAKKAYNQFAQEVRDLLKVLAPQQVEQTALIDDLDDLFKLPEGEETNQDEGEVASMKPRISGIRTSRPSKKLKAQKGGAGTGTGKGNPGVKGNPPKASWDKPLKDSEGEAIVTTDWQGKSQANFLRIVPQNDLAGSVKIFLTIEKPGRYVLELYKAGETENQYIPMHNLETNQKSSSLEFSTTKVDERKELRAKIPSDALKFALEGVTRVLSK